MVLIAAWSGTRIEQLVGADAQRVEHLGLDLGQRPVGAGGQDRVVGARRRIVPDASSVANAASRPGRLPQQRGQHEVGVRVVAAHRLEHVEAAAGPGRRLRRAVAGGGRRGRPGGRFAARSRVWAAVGGRPGLIVPIAVRARTPARPVGGRHLLLAGRLTRPARPARWRCRPAPRSFRPEHAGASAVAGGWARPVRLEALAAEVVQAPGRGCWRGSGGPRRTPARPVDAASSTVIFGARRDPVRLLRHGPGVPSSIASSTATSSPAPATASRAERSRGVARADRSVSVPKTGPVSRPASSWNTVAPVNSSPCQIACCTGRRAPPGGQQREVQVHPAVPGMSSAAAAPARRRRPPDAVRGELVAGAGTPARGAGGLERLDAVVVGPAAPAGRAAGCRPRPAGASGRVTTATSSWRDARSRPARQRDLGRTGEDQPHGPTGRPRRRAGYLDPRGRGRRTTGPHGSAFLAARRAWRRAGRRTARRRGGRSRAGRSGPSARCPRADRLAVR